MFKGRFTIKKNFAQSGLTLVKKKVITNIENKNRYYLGYSR